MFIPTFNFMVKVTQLCLTLCHPMDCSPWVSSVHGILQARILEWVAMPSSREPSWPRDRTQVSCTADRFFTIWATREALFLLKVMIISFPSFFYDLGYKNRCAWSNFSSQACSHTHWAGQERENGFVGGPLNSHAFIPGTRESFPHFTLLELTEKKEWKSRRVTVFETIQKVFGYIFDCSYYHKASSFFSQLGKYTYFIAT